MFQTKSWMAAFGDSIQNWARALSKDEILNGFVGAGADQLQAQLTENGSVRLRLSGL